MSEVQTIKETKEIVAAAIVVGRFVIERMKDGVDFGDAKALGEKLLQPEFRAMVMEGAKGVELVPAELSDLSVTEGFELLETVLQAFNAPVA